MPGVTKEQIEKAKEWDLLSYLQTYALALIMQFGFLSELTLNWKYAVAEQLLYAERKKNQQISETTEIINRKCHDLKHQIAGLKKMKDGPERSKYFHEVENAIMIYESAVKSGNETLDLNLLHGNTVCKQK